MNIHLIHTFHQIFHDHNDKVKIGHRINIMSSEIQTSIVKANFRLSKITLLSTSDQFDAR